MPLRAIVALILAVCACGADSLQQALRAQNSAGPLLILVSLDGFRWDYMQKAPAPNLTSLASRGVRADGLIPSFPTKTFPNHYTIVTGLYPGHHGIVANSIRDPETGRTFAMSKTKEVRDPMWWGGEPLWVAAERAGLRSGTMFWPGSEAPIKGVLPTYWRAYNENNESVRGGSRVDQILSWLDLPQGRRPSFLTLYFEDTDSAGHDAGPDSEDVRRAIVRVDGYIGRLLRGLERRGLADRANIVVVSDHGMAPTIRGQVLRLSDFISLRDVDVSDINPTLGLFPKRGKEEAVYRALAAASPHLRVYLRAQTPAAWHYRDHKRIPPIVGVVDEGWEIIRGTLTDLAQQQVHPQRGSHGYDPAVRSMHGIFVAAGPAFKRAVAVQRFENVHIYNALAAVLKVTPAANDGDPVVARTLLR